MVGIKLVSASNACEVKFHLLCSIQWPGEQLLEESICGILSVTTKLLAFRRKCTFVFACLIRSQKGLFRRVFVRKMKPGHAWERNLKLPPKASLHKGFPQTGPSLDFCSQASPNFICRNKTVPTNPSATL